MSAPPTGERPDVLRAWLLTGPVVRDLRAMLRPLDAGRVAVILAAGIVAPELGAGEGPWVDVQGRRVAVLPLARAAELAAIRAPGIAQRLRADAPGDRCAWCLYLENLRAEVWPFPVVPLSRPAPMGDA